MGKDNTEKQYIYFQYPKKDFFTQINQYDK